MNRELNAIFIDNIHHAINESLLVMILDRNGQIVFVNDKFCQVSKFTREELMKTKDRTNFLTYIGNMGEEKTWRGETRHEAKDKTVFWLDTTIVPVLDEEGDLETFVTLSLDITLKKQQEEQLKRREERYRLITENSPDLIVTTDYDGNILYSSPSYTNFFSESHSIERSNIFHLVHEKERDYVIREFRKMFSSGKTPDSLQFQLEKNRETMIDVEATMNPVIRPSGEKYAIFIIRDVSSKKKSERLMYQLAYHDIVTELPNRRFFMERLRKELYQSKRTHSKFAIVYLDIDKFKYINDTYGHEIGDYALIQFAKIIKSNLRPNDLFARMGGDEFTLLLPNISGKEEVKEIIEKIKDKLQTPLKIKDRSFPITCSIGISLFPEDGNDVGELLKRADMALYSVKEQGRNEFRFFKNEMEEKSLERMLLESELQKAIKEHQFFIEYQPKKDVMNGKLIGMEALLRWRHPKIGVIPPLKFIPIAEETGLITSLGKWVLHESCKQNKHWQQKGYPPLTVSVNVSPRQIVPDLIDTVKHTLEATKLEAKWLELEVTENVFTDLEEAATILQQIRQLGVHISIDDFGTGYNSFNYIKELPVDTIKIDTSLIQDIDHNEESKAIVKAMIEFANMLQLNVIAEGVETKEQLAHIQTDGCNQAQGFLFSHPLPQEKFETYLQSIVNEEAKKR